mmetsp:Transcript_69457/g.157624  ORF Transcript_69457/g.157624 Transcript_69457/m.157624 type:complete len:274 (+) Transcript_69457:95-916(+)
MPRSSSAQLPAGLGLLAGGLLSTGAFVPGPAARGGGSGVAPARGGVGAQVPVAASAEPQQQTGATVAVAGTGLALAAVLASRQRPAQRTRAPMRAEAAAAPKAPPPPPPFDPAKQPGVTLPLLYFDPLGFSKVGDKEGFRNLRVAELKHGRVAMMAALGAVLQHWIKLPGFENVPSGIDAVVTPPGTYGLIVLFLASGAVELTVGKQDPEKEPGDFGDPLSVGQYYEEWRNRELNNGRFAMIAIMGILVAELITGKDGVDQVWTTTVGNLPVE